MLRQLSPHLDYAGREAWILILQHASTRMRSNRYVSRNARISRSMKPAQSSNADELHELVRTLWACAIPPGPITRRDVGDGNEQAGLGAEADLGVAIAAGQLLGECRTSACSGFMSSAGYSEDLSKVDPASRVLLLHRGFDCFLCPGDDRVGHLFQFVNSQSADLELDRMLSIIPWAAMFWLFNLYLA